MGAENQPQHAHDTQHLQPDDTDELTTLRRQIEALTQAAAAHRQAEEARQESERRYRSLVENSLGLICIHALDGTLLAVNPAAAQSLGYYPETGVGMNLRLFLAPDVRHLFDEYLAHIQQQSTVSGVMRLLTKHGEERFWLYRNVRHEEPGRSPYVIGHALDITERIRTEEALKRAYAELESKVSARTAELERANRRLRVQITERRRAEQALQQAEAKYRTLVEHAREAIVIVQESKIVYANRAFVTLTGYPWEETRHLDFTTCIAPEDRHHVVARYHQCLQGEEMSVYEEADIITKDGQRRTVEFEPSLLTYQERPAIMILWHDITARKRAEETHARLAAIVDSSEDAIVGNTLDGTITSWNAGAERIYGYTSAEILGQPVLFLTPPENQPDMSHIYAQIAEGKRLEHYETLGVRKDGTCIQISLALSPIRDATGKMVGTSAIARDMTEYKRSQEELLKNQKIESLGVLAGGIAHDFNNLLTGILGNISLAKMLTDSPDELVACLQDAERACNRATSLTQQLLTFSKGGAPVRQTANIAELMHDSVDFVLRGSNVRCDIVPLDNLWDVEIDSGQINQVLHHVILNADQAMPDGGLIHLQAENIISDATSGLPLAAGPYVKLTISDHGCGIPPTDLPKIFDPYFTTKTHASGLGLAIAYAIITKHEGYITIDSTVDVGTTVSLYLPATPQSSSSPSHDVQLTPMVQSGRILVMDDDPIIRNVLVGQLSRLGYDVVCACRGEEALTLYRQAQEAAHPFTTVILDLTIPGGMGGKETMAHLQAIDPQVCALVSSGYASDPIMANFRQYGFRGVVVKPYTLQELYNALQHVRVKQTS